MLNAGEIQVWRVSLDEIDPDALPPLLPEEVSRAERFRSVETRSRFIRSHGVLRGILAGLGLPSVFVRDDRGKPLLSGVPGVHFNMARSDGMAIYAVAPGVETGVDIERVRPLPEYMAIAERFFPPAQYEALLEAHEETRLAEFFRIWTRLEASLKATGAGLYGAGAELEGAWTIEEVDAGACFAAAVAGRAEGLRVVMREFS
jgi:4'-phosphopantetheinyl transferase